MPKFKSNTGYKMKHTEAKGKHSKASTHKLFGGMGALSMIKKYLGKGSSGSGGGAKSIMSGMVPSVSNWARQAGAKPRNSGSTTTAARTRKTKRRTGGLMSFFRG